MVIILGVQRGSFYQLPCTRTVIHLYIHVRLGLGLQRRRSKHSGASLLHKLWTPCSTHPLDDRPFTSTIESICQIANADGCRDTHLLGTISIKHQLKRQAYVGVLGSVLSSRSGNLSRSRDEPLQSTNRRSKYGGSLITYD